MKKLLILLFSILLSFNSYANWEKVLQLDEGDFYIHMDSIERTGNTTYIWTMRDNSNPKSSNDYNSAKTFLEVECIASKRVRSLTEIRYAQRMGKGDEVKTDNSLGEWGYIPPDNPVYIIFKYACK